MKEKQENKNRNAMPPQTPIRRACPVICSSFRHAQLK
jgi:hypothetical protein